MPLVRCTCVVEIAAAAGRAEARVLVVDPGCHYVVHRLGGELAEAEGSDSSH